MTECFIRSLIHSWDVPYVGLPSSSPARAENKVLKERVKVLEEKCKLLTVENETLKAEVEIYREEAAALSQTASAGASTSVNTTRTDDPSHAMTSSGENQATQNQADDFVKGGDGIYASSTKKEGRILLENLHGNANILCCSMSSDDSVLATGGADRSVTLCQWGKASGVSSGNEDEMKKVTAEIVTTATSIDCGAPVIALDFARKSIRTKFLAAGCMDGTVHVIYYDINTGIQGIQAKEVAMGHIKHGKYVRQVEWAPNNDLLATSSADGSVMVHKLIWNGMDDTGGVSMEKVQSLQLPGPVESMCFQNGQTLCCYARGSPNLICFDLADGFAQQKINLNQGPGNAGFDDHVSFAVMDMAPYGNNYLALATDTSRNIVMDWRSGRQIRNLYGHQNDSYSQPKLAWSKNGQYLYGNTQHDSVVCVWDICSSTIVNRLEGHSNTVRDMFSSMSTDMLVTTSFDKMTYLRFAPT